MITRSIAVLTALFILCGACTTDAAAQSCVDSMAIVWLNYFPPYPGWTCKGTDSRGVPLGIVVCTRPKSNCPPPRPPCLSCSKGATAGHPIDLSSGNTYIQQTDIRIPGLAGGLVLARTWNSIGFFTQGAPAVGMFGRNWYSSYEERVFLGDDGYLTYSRADGSVWSFGYDPNTSTFKLAAPVDGGASLVTDTTNWIMTFRDGEQRLFSYLTGSLLSITDRNGNVTQLSYDGANRLVTITDPVGRHLSFSYLTASSYLVIGVSSDVGLSLSYTYDAQARLITVTKPDQSTFSFEYNSNSLITAVKDSDGKILESHTYDAHGRGLTSSRANGVDAITVSYPKLDPPTTVIN
jgi:YD repeat-containing protein